MKILQYLKTLKDLWKVSQLRKDLHIGVDGIKVSAALKQAVLTLLSDKPDIWIVQQLCLLFHKPLDTELDILRKFIAELPVDKAPA